MAQPMPAVFVGHGNPMNALLDNGYTRGWAALGETMPRPDAILAVSAHWYIRGTSVTSMPRPRTIHDFGGFPPDLYRIDYPAPGDPRLAERVRRVLSPIAVTADSEWGLDHGVWTVLRHIFPGADIPVVQLSIDRRQPPEFHYEVGTRLGPLRNEGILVLGSGNLVHNLHAYAWGQRPAQPYRWAVEFERKVRGHLVSGDVAALVGYDALGRDAELAVPTPDHYLPLLYVVGLQRGDDPVSFPVEGIDGGSVSMLAVRIG